MSSRITRCKNGTKTAEWARSRGKVWQTLTSIWYTLISPWRLQFLVVCILVRMSWLAGDVARRVTASLVLGEWLRHPTSRRSSSVRVESEDIFFCAHCQQMLRLPSLRIHFPLLSIFLDFWQLLIHVSLFFISLPFISSVSSGLRNSLISSSHLFFGLPTGLYVWCLMLRPGFHSATLFAQSFIW